MLPYSVPGSTVFRARKYEKTCQEVLIVVPGGTGKRALRHGGRTGKYGEKWRLASQPDIQSGVEGPAFRK